ncbi:hypothetical protein ABZ793_33975 [Micromonospora sp. NPDC047465]|uniref:hypothetical protein n=1 Tax=Micromonospora sp. NPDC047465 TaxID=3154813 RepID=UPI0033F49E61
MPFEPSTEASHSAIVIITHLPTQIEYSLPRLEGTIMNARPSEEQITGAYQALVDLFDAHPDWTVQATYVRGASHPITPTVAGAEGGDA